MTVFAVAASVSAKQHARALLGLGRAGIGLPIPNQTKPNFKPTVTVLALRVGTRGPVSLQWQYGVPSTQCRDHSDSRSCNLRGRSVRNDTPYSTSSMTYPASPSRSRLRPTGAHLYGGYSRVLGRSAVECPPVLSVTVPHLPSPEGWHTSTCKALLKGPN